MVPEPHPSQYRQKASGFLAGYWVLLLLGAVQLSTVGYIAYDKLSDRDPKPTPVVEAKFDPVDTRVELDGVRLDDAKVKLFCDVVNAGKGQFVATYHPVGKQKQTRTVTVSDGIDPLPPVPPGPNPPVPPGPNPSDPAPIPTDGFRVLFVYETNPTSAEAILSKEQQAALFSPNVEAYLNAKCAKGPSGTPEWRRYDQHQDVSKESRVWQDAMKLPRNVIPWVVVSNGKSGESVPMPGTEAELLALFKKYGG